MLNQSQLTTGCDRSQPTKAPTSRRTPNLPGETRAIFTGDQERLDHLRSFEVAIKLVQLVQPEMETTVIRIASQVAKVLHPHKRFVELRLREPFILRYSS